MVELEQNQGQADASSGRSQRRWRATSGVVLTFTIVFCLLCFGLVEAAPATDLGLYQAIERAFNQLSNEINVSQYGLTSDQVFAVVQQVIDHNPRIIYHDYSNSSLYSDGRLLFRYTESPTEIRRMWAAYDQAIASILAEVIKPGQTQMEQVMAVHDYLVSHISYDTNGAGTESHTAYGALIYRSGVCESYARAMQGLLSTLQVPCQIVTGTSDGVAHAWNMVQLDGQYFHLDATWDDPIPDVPARVLHSYFLVPDQVMRQDHSWAGVYPASSSSKYAYLYQQDEILTTGGFVYFIDQQEKLGRMRADGSARQSLTKERVAYLATDGEWVYYCNLSNRGYLYKTSLNGDVRRQINSEASRDMRVRDGWIYYSSWDGKTEWRIQPDGTDRARVTETVQLGQAALILNSGERPTQLSCTASVGTDSLTWSSTNQRVAKVTGGQVIPLAPGQTLVQAITPQGKVADCLVTVLSSAPSVTEITLTIGRAEALVNGLPQAIAAAPYVKAATGRALVPLRFVSETLGADVEWLGATRQVVISSGDKKIVLTLGSDHAVVNGQTQLLDCPAELSGNSCCVPLRFVSENLGASVVYISASRQITITEGQ